MTPTLWRKLELPKVKWSQVLTSSAWTRGLMTLDVVKKISIMTLSPDRHLQTILTKLIPNKIEIILLTWKIKTNKMKRRKRKNNKKKESLQEVFCNNSSMTQEALWRICFLKMNYQFFTHGCRKNIVYFWRRTFMTMLSGEFVFIYEDHFRAIHAALSFYQVYQLLLPADYTATEGCWPVSLADVKECIFRISGAFNSFQSANCVPLVVVSVYWLQRHQLLRCMSRRVNDVEKFRRADICIVEYSACNIQTSRILLISHFSLYTTFHSK